ncbi:MAG: hypothetical protein ACR2FN_09330 [Chitinophagaceae bacterium]
MKHLKFFNVIFFLSAILFSCSSNNAANKDSNTASSDNSNASNSSSSGNAVFSYSLDGTKVSGGEVDELQINNVAEIYQSDPSGKELIFLLNDGEQKNTDIVAHSLRFTIPYKTGVVDLTADQQNSWNVELFLPSGQVVGSRLAYGQESFRITLTNISSTRISGTFSGAMKKSEVDKSSAKSEVTITDGKFDIPVKNVQN